MNKRSTPEQRTSGPIARIARVTTLGLALAIGPAQAARAQTVTPPPVPDNLRVPAPNQAFLLGRGVGTQNYVCLPADSLGRVDWALFTPEATLFSDLKEQLTSHFFSPNPDEGGTIRATWVDSRDTSTVWARALASSVDPNFVNPGAIPWVLLQVVGTEIGPTAGATLAGTRFIQRLNTVGGAAPPTGCDVPTDIGSTRFVPYTADYFFFRR